MMVLLKICLPSFSLVITVLNVTEPALMGAPPPPPPTASRTRAGATGGVAGACAAATEAAATRPPAAAAMNPRRPIELVSFEVGLSFAGLMSLMVSR